MKKYFSIIIFFICSNSFACSKMYCKTADYVSLSNGELFSIKQVIGSNSNIYSEKSINFEIQNNTALFVEKDAKFEAKENITFICNGLEYILPKNVFKGFVICNKDKIIISKQD